MSCGFGAVVLLFMISKHATTRLEQPRVDYAGEIARLEQQVGDAGARLEHLAAQRAARGPELAAARAAARAAREALAASQATAPAAGGGADEIAALRASIAKLEAEKRSLLAQPEEKSRYVRAFVGEGNREYLTGVQQGGRRILVLLDTSSSMLDASPVEAIRKRNMAADVQRAAPKWQQALATVEWIVAHFPERSRYQLYGFDAQARPALAGTEGQWLPVANSAQLDGAVAALRARLPAGGNNLAAAFKAIARLEPPPDNVYLITDGLPTQGLAPTRGGTVSGRERQRLFEEALTQLPSGIPVNTILLPLEGDPMAASTYWQLARVTQGAFLCPAEDWP